MIDDIWNVFCVVGIGPHAISKIIPAIKANGQKIFSIVTKKGGIIDPNVTLSFNDIDMALESAPEETCFIIASPPEAHHYQALSVIKSNRDLLVEKPIFRNTKECETVRKELRNRKIVIGENFMHKEVAYYRIFKEYWESYSAIVEKISVRFFIQSFSPNTFRDGLEIEELLLYDMGCYGIDLLVDLEVAPQTLNAKYHECITGNSKVLKIYGSENIDIEIEVGIFREYQNSVSIYLKNGKTLVFSPFFFGRPGSRKIQTILPDGQVHNRIVMENDAFQALFSKPRQLWLNDQKCRLKKMSKVAKILDDLNNELSNNK